MIRAGAGHPDRCWWCDSGDRLRALQGEPPIGPIPSILSKADTRTPYCDLHWRALMVLAESDDLFPALRLQREKAHG